MDTKSKDQIMMELYKEAYLQWLPEIKKFTNNVAKEQAELAVNSFDEHFKQAHNEQK
jgi:hypothetical protein